MIFRCHSCRRRSSAELDHVGHRCAPWRVWLVRWWRRLVGYEYGP